METDDRRSVIAIDPGRSKCGIALVQIDKTKTVERLIVPTDRLIVTLSSLLREHPAISVVLIGSGTGSGTLVRAIKETLPSKKLTIVDEIGTTLLARERYLKDNPPRGWRRLVPKGLLIPKTPIDDYAALILAERYLDGAPDNPGA